MARKWIQAVFVKTGGAAAADASDDERARSGGRSSGSGRGEPECECECDGGDGGGGCDDDEASGVASLGGDLACLFSPISAASTDGAQCPPSPHGVLAAATRPTVVRLPGWERDVTLALVGRDAQHTERATGSMLWEGALSLGAHVAADPTLVAGAAVVELGCGAAAVAALASAAAGAGWVTATDGHPGVVALAAANIEAAAAAAAAAGATAAAASAAAAAPAAPRVTVARLRWGHARDVASAVASVRAAAEAARAAGIERREQNDEPPPPNFRVVVLAADVVYNRDALRPLMATAAALMRAVDESIDFHRGGTVFGESCVWLSHVPFRGGVSDDEVIAAAAEEGVQLRHAPSAARKADGVVAACSLLRGTLVR